MLNLEKLFSVPGIPTLLSVVIGFGIAALFRPLCKGSECIIVRGPPVNEIRGSVYQYGSKCVEFRAKPVACPKKITGEEIVETLSLDDGNALF